MSSFFEEQNEEYIRLLLFSCLLRCGPVDCGTPCFPVLHCLPDLFKLMSIESVIPSNGLILCHLLLLLPSIFATIRVFSSELAFLIWWPKYWNFSFSLSSEYSGLISFRIDWLDLCCPWDSQESSFTPQFKGVNSLALSLYGLAMTSVHDYWENHR